MARHARRFLIHNVEAMPAAFSQAVDRAKTLIAENTLAAMAFVAERVIRGAFRAEIREHQLPFQQRRKNGTVRPIRAGTTSGGALVAVMTIRAGHQARGGPRREQARHIAIFSDGFNRMKGRIRHAKLNALVRFLHLAIHPRRPARHAVAMTAEADFVLLVGGFHDGAAGIDAHHTRR